MIDESTPVLSTPAKRLEHALRVLHGRGIRQVEVAEALGISSGFASELVNGKKRLRADHATKIEAELGISKVWLMFGEGPMLVDKTQQKEHGREVYKMVAGSAPGLLEILGKLDSEKLAEIMAVIAIMASAELERKSCVTGA